MRNVKNQKISLFDIAESVVKNSSRGASVIIPHLCSTKNIFSGGIAKEISERYPIVKANFEVSGPKILGKTQLIKALTGFGDQSIYIAAIPSIDFDKYAKIRIRYQFFIEGMMDIKKYIVKLSEYSSKNNFQIHISSRDFPCHKNEFSFIKNIIDDVWDRIPRYYY